MNRCFTNVLSFLSLTRSFVSVRLTLFRHIDYGSVDYFIYWRHANSNTCRTAALHAILSFFVYDPQGQGVCVAHPWYNNNLYSISLI